MDWHSRSQTNEGSMSPSQIESELFLVTRTRGPAWESQRRMREQTSWEASLANPARRLLGG